MTDTTTAAKLTAGARVYAEMTDEGPAFAKSATASGVEVATLLADPVREGRKYGIDTDCGRFEVGGATKVLLAEQFGEEETEEPATADAPEEPALPQVAPSPIIATVTTDSAGRLTHFSKLRVQDGGRVVEHSVPWKVDEPSGACAPVRLAATLLDMGYNALHTWRRDPDGRTWCAVVPVTPGE